MLMVEILNPMLNFNIKKPRVNSRNAYWRFLKIHSLFGANF